MNLYMIWVVENPNPSSELEQYFTPFRHAAVVAEDEEDALLTFFRYRSFSEKNQRKMRSRYEARYVAPHKAENPHVLGTF